MPLTSDDAAREIMLVQDGHNILYVAQLLYTILSTISSTLANYREVGSYSQRPGSGRKPTTRDDHFLRLQVFRDRLTTAVQARNHFEKICGVNVSEWTARRRLHEAHLMSRRNATDSELTP